MPLWLPILAIVVALVAPAPAVAAGGTWSATGSMMTARGDPTATLLQNGKVLVEGGLDSSGKVLSSAELYDPTTGTWSATGSMLRPRLDPTATLLQNGKVLVAGGAGPMASAELYNPTSGTWSMTGRMQVPRWGAMAALLPNGKVLVSGGVDAPNTPTAILASAELYDPTTGSWSMTAGMAFPRVESAMVLLRSGQAMAVGGVAPDPNVPPGAVDLTSAELYDPATGTWSPTGSMTYGRDSHTATLLANGDVLVAGGGGVTQSEVYDPNTGTWTTSGSLNVQRFLHTATLLPDGRVLVAGGAFNGNQAAATAELYDPATGRWSRTASMSIGRIYPAAVLLPDGRVLLAGGSSALSDELSSAELFTPGPPDRAAPTCGLTAVITGPPKAVQVTVQDRNDGLSNWPNGTITTTQSNATVRIPQYDAGTTSPVVITFTKIDQAQPAHFGVTATDTTGNSSTCDPADVTISRTTGEPHRTTIHGIHGYENSVTIANGTPGLTKLDVIVNGHRFVVKHLVNGTTTTLDIGRALHRGAHNTAKLVPLGERGGTAQVVIWGVAPRAKLGEHQHGIDGDTSAHRPSGKSSLWRRDRTAPERSRGGGG